MNANSRELLERVKAQLEQRAAERDRQVTLDPHDVEQRLRAAADHTGRIDVDEAMRALTGTDESTFSDAIRGALDETADRQRDANRAMTERIFPTSEPVEPPTQPLGDADGGVGQPDDIQLDSTQDGQLLRIWPL